MSGHTTHAAHAGAEEDAVTRAVHAEVEGGAAAGASAVDVRERVLAALVGLLNEKPFDKLTVREICRAAGISSPTFYKYFSDKYHIAQWHFDCVIEDGLAQIGRTLSWREGYLRHLNHLVAQKTLFTPLMKMPPGYQSLMAYGRRKHAEELRRTIVEFKHRAVSDELDFQIGCVVQTGTRSAVDWVQGDMQRSAEVYATYLANAVPRKLFDLLNTPGEVLL